MMLKLAFVGDISIIHGETITCGQRLKEYLNSCDYRICNFEGAINSGNEKPINKFGPLVIQTPNSIEVLKQIGINIACLANNHIYDYGYKAANNTVELLKQSGIQHIGMHIDSFDSIYRPVVLEKDDVKVALFNAAENGFGCSNCVENKGYAWLFSPVLRERIKEYKSMCDYVLLFSHGGLENEPIPLPEWRQAYQEMIDLGVDAVIATHAHLVQPMEIYNGKPIYYSLGNFVYQENGYDPKSQLVLLEITKQSLAYSEVNSFYDREKGIVECYCENGIGDLQAKYNKMINNIEEYYEYINRVCLEVYNDSISEYYAWGECVYHKPL